MISCCFPKKTIRQYNDEAVIKQSVAATETNVNHVITPLRLIDVLDASLKKNGHILFCLADHGDPWDWHIISHTWSRDIRALSKAVGESISTNITTAPASEDLYRAKFEAHNWLKELEEEGCESMSDELLAKAYLFVRGCEKSEKLKLIRAYLSIREFLEILGSQEIKKVWLDAICINQCNNAEKAREIPRMADYYKKSKACYVPINGFADEESGRRCKGACNSTASSIGVKRAIVEPYLHVSHFCKISVPSAYKWPSTDEYEDENEDEDTIISNCDGCGGLNDYRLPPDKELVELRWFNRVWTLQEFKLPRDQIYFVIQLESWMVEWLSLFIFANGGETKQVCNRVKSVFYCAAERSKKGEVENAVINDLRQIVKCRFLKNHVRCGFCLDIRNINGVLEKLHNVNNNANNAWNIEMLSRKLKHHKQPRLYIFNTEVLFVVGCMAHAWRQMSGRHIPIDKIAPVYKRYRDLYRNIKGHIAYDETLHWAMDEICSRECHENHSEDRILGLLGLLPLREGMNYTVRTGKKSPEQQLVDLAHNSLLS